MSLGAASEGRVNVAVIGTGRMGMLYGRIVNESPVLRLVAGCGNTKDRAAKAESVLGVPVYANGDHRTMLERHPEIEALIVATPEWAHVAPTVAALNAGKHVLLEKPLASSEEESTEIARSVRESTSVFMVCHSVRFDPRYALAQEAVTRGDIGEVRHMYARRNADREAAQRVLGRFNLAYWLMPHDVDVMRWITGQEVVEVSVASGSGGHGEDDYLLATLKFSGGATGIIENSWASGPIDGRPRNGLLDIHGSKGMVEVRAYEQGLVIRRLEGDTEAPDTIEAVHVHDRVMGAFPALVHHFADCIMNGKRPITGLPEAMATMQVSGAMARSLSEGGRSVPVALQG